MKENTWQEIFRFPHSSMCMYIRGSDAKFTLPINKGKILVEETIDTKSMSLVHSFSIWFCWHLKQMSQCGKSLSILEVNIVCPCYVNHMAVAHLSFPSQVKQCSDKCFFKIGNRRKKLGAKSRLKRLRCSRGSVLAFGTQLRGFKPDRSRWIFQGEKILSTPSFGGEVKPSVPYRRFTACKRSLNVTWKSGIFRQNSSDISRPCSSAFGC